MFALVLPLILLFASFVVDTANWWEHKRHLQMQADAAALAGAASVGIPCAQDVVDAQVLKYSGASGSTYNEQVGGATDEGRIHMAVNSKTWPLQDSPVDTTVIEGDPCETAMVDVKLTETDTPWLLGMAPALGIDGPDFINARARASIVRVDTLSGALPIGVPDVNPKKGKVQFIDEDDVNKRVLGEADLTRIGNFNGLSKWEVPATSAIPLTVDSSVKNIGVRVILSGSTSVTCGQILVDCYDTQSTKGLVHLRRAVSGGNGVPTVGSVGLRATNCTEAYFTASSTTCSTGLSAEVDFGDPSPVSALGAKVTATVGNKTYNTTYTNGRWELPGNDLIPVTTAAGPVEIELGWEQTKGTRNGQTCKTGGSNPCKNSFGVIQRAFAGSDLRSGPLRIVKVYDNGLPLSDHSLADGVHNLTVEIGLLGALSDAKTVDAPLVGLRVTGGSQNQSLDCDTALSQLKDEIAAGCGASYKINQGTACPAAVNDLWASAQPWPCVAVQTGGAVGQVSAGMNKRILGDEKPSSCTAPNNWTNDFPSFQASDPRIVQVFLTPYGAFSGSGNTTVPVTNFATFYVTGWVSNGGFNNPCAGNGDEIEGAGEAGYIYGRFIKYIQTLPSGGGDTKCDFESFGACTMVLTD